MQNQLYLENCEKILEEFEKSQSMMLKLDLSSAGIEFSNQIKKLYRLFEKTSKELINHSFEVKRDKILLTKQIERLMIFLKEMELHISEFQKDNSLNENEIIFIFERQHLFKNIYKKHLSDYAAILNS